jgi:hypothetical protein
VFRCYVDFTAALSPSIYPDNLTVFELAHGRVPAGGFAMTDKKRVLTVEVFQTNGGYRAEVTAETPHGPFHRGGNFWAARPTPDAALTDVIASIRRDADWTGCSWYRGVGRPPKAMRPAQFVLRALEASRRSA